MTGNIKIKCSKCGVEYRSDQKQEHDIKYHEGALIECPFEGCLETFKTHAGKRRHQASHEGVVYECEPCNRTFTTIYELKGHNKSKHSNETWDCTICHETFGSKRKLQQHRNDEHKNRPTHTCPIENCGFSSKEQHQIKLHVLFDHLKPVEFWCEECEIPITNRNSYVGPLCHWQTEAHLKNVKIALSRGKIVNTERRSIAKLCDDAAQFYPSVFINDSGKTSVDLSEKLKKTSSIKPSSSIIELVKDNSIQPTIEDYGFTMGKKTVLLEQVPPVRDICHDKPDKIKVISERFKTTNKLDTRGVVGTTSCQAINCQGAQHGYLTGRAKFIDVGDPNVGGFRLPIEGHYTDKTNNIAYCIRCLKHCCWYMGESEREFGQRLQQHEATVNMIIKKREAREEELGVTSLTEDELNKIAVSFSPTLNAYIPYQNVQKHFARGDCGLENLDASVLVAFEKTKAGNNDRLQAEKFFQLVTESKDLKKNILHKMREYKFGANNAQVTRLYKEYKKAGLLKEMGMDCEDGQAVQNALNILLPKNNVNSTGASQGFSNLSLKRKTDYNVGSSKKARPDYDGF